MVVESFNEDEQWAAVSDLMTVLMLIFMFIAIVFVRTLVQQEEVFKTECDKIYRVLEMEFSEDFKSWQVDLLEDLTIRFRNPEILFLTGESNISPKFEMILAEFFPRYMEAIIPYKDDIQEIRIEGHTSSEYEAAQSEDDKYIENMRLSQDRTREILKFVLATQPAQEYKKWAKSKITANGLSSSKLRYIEDNNGISFEDPEGSRRVEFRLLTSSCQKAGRYEQSGEKNV